jgi:hypothetical protein
MPPAILENISLHIVYIHLIQAVHINFTYYPRYHEKTGSHSFYDELIRESVEVIREMNTQSRDRRQ